MSEREIIMKVEQLLEIAIRVGDILLRSGAEIYRVQDTIIRVCSAYSVNCDCFVVLSGIFLSAKGENGNKVTLIKHIDGEFSADFSRIELINSFSRKLGKKTVSYEEASRILDNIENNKQYGFLPRLLAASAMSFVYAMFFSGNIKEAAAAFIVSILVYTLKEGIGKIITFQFVEYFISGFLIGTFSLLAVNIFSQMNIYKIITGSIMILVPGVAITNGVKDALYGDTISSLYRLTEALFITIAVGAGVAMALTIRL